MFSFQLTGTEYNLSHLRYTVYLKSAQDKEKAANEFAIHAFERMKDEDSLRSMLAEIDDNNRQAYGTPPQMVVQYGGVAQYLMSLRRFHPEFDTFLFHYSYFIDALYVRNRVFRQFKAVITLKRFFRKLCADFLEYTYCPGNVGFFRAKQAFDSAILSDAAR